MSVCVGVFAYIKSFELLVRAHTLTQTHKHKHIRVRNMMNVAHMWSNSHIEEWNRAANHNFIILADISINCYVEILSTERDDKSHNHSTFTISHSRCVCL